MKIITINKHRILHLLEREITIFHHGNNNMLTIILIRHDADILYANRSN